MSKKGDAKIHLTHAISTWSFNFKVKDIRDDLEQSSWVISLSWL